MDILCKGDIELAIVDDDVDLSNEIKDSLEAEDFRVVVFHDAPDFLDYVQNRRLPHLVLVDLNLPSTHGFQLSDQLKACGDLPIIFISSDVETRTVVTGINKYADDYITKPFEMEILLARVNRLLNRVYGLDDQTLTQIDKRLAVDLVNNRAYMDDRIIVLTPTESRLLSLLVRNMGYTIPSETLIAHGWPRQNVLDETFRVHMHRLRRKLEPKGESSYIQTVRGVGYCFCP
ncbi:MAG: response regulator transcription factor [Anaerolineae bacterium]|nr:response regulator transcription factor [Anaerolineae bacterium]